MRLSLFFDHRFRRSPDGTLYSVAAYNHDLFVRRYLRVFDEIRVVARVQDCAGADRHGRATEGEGVVVVPAGNWQGPLQYLPARRHLQDVVRAELEHSEAIMMIAPGRIGQVAFDHIARSGRPFGVEVVGDPYDVYAPGAARHPLRPLVRRWAVRQLQRQCRAAAAVAYVNTTTLPERYPAGPDAFATSYSSIELEDAHVATARRNRPFSGEFGLVTVGSMESPYKGIDVLLRAFAALPERFGTVHLTVIGDGAHRKELEALARDLGVASRVTFLGRLPAGTAVRERLDAADLFVLASRTEGLPRAMIEAMARGLPSVGTRVGGIPELLDASSLVEPESPRQLADLLAEVIPDVERRNRMTELGLERARGYKADTLTERRVALYRRLREETEAWMRAGENRD